MTTQRSNTIQISRGTFAASLLATAVIGIGIGEVASPLASSQAHPIARAAGAPKACDAFAISVGNAFQILGTLLEDASKYPPLIPEAVTAGQHKSTSEVDAITSKVSAVNALVQSEAARFAALKGPILTQEKQCLG
ncbi:MAG: hypothetical protein ABR947_05395 [Solirubrobacteraceae bacterium]|jgi:hypothetical protein